MLKNAYFLAKIGADTAENEQPKTSKIPAALRVVVRERGRDLELGLLADEEALHDVEPNRRPPLPGVQGCTRFKMQIQTTSKVPKYEVHRNRQKCRVKSQKSIYSM